MEKEQEQQLVNKTLDLIEKGNLFLKRRIQYGTLLLGLTKAGKTTSCHYLTHQVLNGVFNDEKRVTYGIIDGANFYSKATIGNKERESETQIPNFFQTPILKQNQCLIDCPGYEDTFKCSGILSNGYFHYQIFSKVQNIKFVIVLQFNDLEGTADKVSLTFEHFFNAFNDYEQDSSQILESLCILITKVPKTLSTEDIEKKFSNLKNLSFSTKNKKLAFNNLKQKILSKNLIFVFQAAELDETCDKQNQILYTINKNVKYWKRQTNELGQPSMNNIRTSIRTLLLQKSNKNWQIQQQLNVIGSNFKQISERKLQKCAEIFKIFIQNSFKPFQKGSQFLDLIKQYVKSEISPRNNRQIYLSSSQARNEAIQNLYKQLTLNEKSLKQEPKWYIQITGILNIDTKYRQFFAQCPQSQVYTQKGLVYCTNLIRDLISLIAKVTLDPLMLSNYKIFAYDIMDFIDTQNNFFRILHDSEKKNLNLQSQKLSFVVTDYPHTIVETLYPVSNQIFIKKQFQFYKNLNKSKEPISQDYLTKFLINLKEKIEKIQEEGDPNCYLSDYSQEQIEEMVKSISSKNLSMQINILNNNLNSIKPHQLDQLKKITIQGYKLLLNLYKKEFKSIVKTKCLNLLAAALLKCSENQSDYECVSMAMQIYKLTTSNTKIISYVNQKRNQMKAWPKGEKKLSNLIKMIRYMSKTGRVQTIAEIRDEAFDLAIELQSQKALQLLNTVCLEINNERIYSDLEFNLDNIDGFIDLDLQTKLEQYLGIGRSLRYICQD